jgi:hypothetical protein
MRLLLLDCGVVIDEDECAVVFGVGVALRALVARTEITLPRLSTKYPTVECQASTHGFIVVGQFVLRCRLLRSLPWSLGTVRADQHPASSEWVESAVRDIVKDCVRHGGLVVGGIGVGGVVGSGLLGGNK